MHYCSYVLVLQAAAWCDEDIANTGRAFSQNALHNRNSSNWSSLQMCLQTPMDSLEDSWQNQTARETHYTKRWTKRQHQWSTIHLVQSNSRICRDNDKLGCKCHNKPDDGFGPKDEHSEYQARYRGKRANKHGYWKGKEREDEIKEFRVFL